MCGSPRSLPRVPSCDVRATKPREGPGGRSPELAPPSLPPLPAPSLPPPLCHSWPSKHLTSGTLTLPLGGEALMGALPLPTWGPPVTFINTGRASIHLS